MHSNPQHDSRDGKPERLVCAERAGGDGNEKEKVSADLKGQPVARFTGLVLDPFSWFSSKWALLSRHDYFMSHLKLYIFNFREF